MADAKARRLAGGNLAVLPQHADSRIVIRFFFYQGARPHACIQERHIQNDDVSLLLFGEDAPLAEDFFIVSAKPVDAFDDKCIARPEFSHQTGPIRPVEVFAGEFLEKDSAVRDAENAHDTELAVEILVTGADAAIGIDAVDPFHGYHPP